MVSYPYIIFGCNCNPRCVCSLCNLKAIDCRHAECIKCDKIAGHLGCQNKPSESRKMTCL